MNDLDALLKELGQFGKYQVFTYVLLFFPLALSSIASMTYVFTTGDINYRCFIPECDLNSTEKYDQPWLHDALPYTNGDTLDHCLRYKVKQNLSDESCSKDTFSKDTEFCDHYVFENHENTITREFNLLCEKNKWKRTLVGTLNNIALFIGMPIAGIVSDRFGRKTMLICSVLLSAIFGTIRSFTTNYVQFVIFEMLDAMAYSGLYSGIYIFAVEIIGPDKRGFGGAIISMFYTVGEMILGGIVWLVDDWRVYLRIIYIPCFFFILYCWILPESIRWLVSKRKKEKVAEAFKRISRMNNVTLNEGHKKTIENMCSDASSEATATKGPVEEKKSQSPLREVLRSRVMVLRVMNCSFCWIVHTFVFYGLSLNSVSIAGNKYLNFILVSFVEIPAYMLCSFMVNYCGRKITVCLGLALSGLTCTSFHFIGLDASVVRLVLYFAGKSSITMSFAGLYVLASEIYPTTMRHSLLGFCSTIGRLGSMLAPQIPLMAAYVDPVLVLGCISFVAAALGLYFPETNHCKMPETLEEAANLGRTKPANDKRNQEPSSKEGIPA